MFMIEEDKITCLAKTKLSLCDLSKSTKSQPSNQACKKKSQGGYRKFSKRGVGHLPTIQRIKANFTSLIKEFWEHLCLAIKSL